MRTAVIVAVGALLGACSTPEYIPIQHFTLTPDVQTDQFPPMDITLALRPLDAGQLYRQPMAYRRTPHEVEFYTHARWTDEPRYMVTQALKDALIQTNRFADVGEASDLSMPDLVLTGTLRQFEEVRIGAPSAAVCEVRIEVRETLGPALVWADTLHVEVPVSSNSPDTLAAAMSKAVGQVVSTAANNIAAAVTNSHTPVPAD